MPNEMDHYTTDHCGAKYQVKLNMRTIAEFESKADRDLFMSALRSQSADDDEAITEEWITAEYKAQLNPHDTGCRIRWIYNGHFVCVDKLNAFRSLPITFRLHAFPYPESNGESVSWDKIKTRGQLRKLLSALSIEGRS